MGQIGERRVAKRGGRSRIQPPAIDGQEYPVPTETQIAGDYVGIACGGKVHQCFNHWFNLDVNLGTLLRIEIEVDEPVGAMEHRSSSVSNAELAGSAPVSAVAKLSPISEQRGRSLRQPLLVECLQVLAHGFGGVSQTLPV